MNLLLFILVKHEARGPQALKVTCVPSLQIDMSENSFLQFRLRLKKSNPTLRLLCMLYRLNSCCLKKIQSTNVGREARFGGISNNCICTLSSGANHFKRFLLRDVQAYYRLSFIIFTIFKVSLIIHTKCIQLISTNSKDVDYSCEGQ